MRSCRGFPKPPVRRTSCTMSDCEGLPVGKRQIYIYPGVLSTSSHSQIAKSHAKLLAFEGSRSRSRERRNSLQPLQILVQSLKSSWWRAGVGGNAWFFSKGTGAGKEEGFSNSARWSEVPVSGEMMVSMYIVSSSRRRVSGDGSCRTKRAVYVSCSCLDKPSRMVMDAARGR